MPRLVPSPNSRNLNERRADHRDARQPKTQGDRFGGRSTYETFIAKILASPVSVGTNRWRYAWEEVVVKDDHGIATPSAKRASRGAATGAGSEFTYALNMCEMCQSLSASLIGPGVTVSSIPSGFSLQPIAEGTCVVMHAMNRRSGRPLFAFSMPNAIDGACA